MLFTYSKYWPLFGFVPTRLFKTFNKLVLKRFYILQKILKMFLLIWPIMLFRKNIRTTQSKKSNWFGQWSNLKITFLVWIKIWKLSPLTQKSKIIWNTCLKAGKINCRRKKDFMSCWAVISFWTNNWIRICWKLIQTQHFSLTPMS